MKNLEGVNNAIVLLGDANNAMIEAISKVVLESESREIEFEKNVIPSIDGRLVIAENDYNEIMCYSRHEDGGIEEIIYLDDLTANDLFDICCEILEVFEK